MRRHARKQNTKPWSEIYLGGGGCFLPTLRFLHLFPFLSHGPSRQPLFAILTTQRTRLLAAMIVLLLLNKTERLKKKKCIHDVYSRLIYVYFLNLFRGCLTYVLLFFDFYLLTYMGQIALWPAEPNFWASDGLPACPTLQRAISRVESAYRCSYLYCVKRCGRRRCRKQRQRAETRMRQTTVRWTQQLQRPRTVSSPTTSSRRLWSVRGCRCFDRRPLALMARPSALGWPCAPGLGVTRRPVATEGSAPGPAPRQRVAIHRVRTAGCASPLLERMVPYCHIYRRIRYGFLQISQKSFSLKHLFREEGGCMQGSEVMCLTVAGWLTFPHIQNVSVKNCNQNWLSAIKSVQLSGEGGLALDPRCTYLGDRIKWTFAFLCFYRFVVTRLMFRCTVDWINWLIDWLTGGLYVKVDVNCHFFPSY